MMKKYRLPRLFGEQWVEILETGHHIQGNGSLHYNAKLIGKTDGVDEYCCIGVALNLLGIPDKAMTNHAQVKFYASYPKDPTTWTDSHKLTKLALKSGFPKELLYNKEDYDTNLAVELARRNDDKGHCFRRIAHWIKTNVELYDEPEQIKNEK